MFRWQKKNDLQKLCRHPYCCCALIKDHWQLIFITLHIFCLLKTLPPVLNLAISSLMEYQPKLNEKFMPFLNCMSQGIYLLNKVKENKITYSHLFFCCSIQALTSADIIFCNNFIQPNLKKDFYLEFSIKGLHNSPKSVEHDKSFLPMLP